VYAAVPLFTFCSIVSLGFKRLDHHESLHRNRYHWFKITRIEVQPWGPNTTLWDTSASAEVNPCKIHNPQPSPRTSLNSQNGQFKSFLTCRLELTNLDAEMSKAKKVNLSINYGDDRASSSTRVSGDAAIDIDSAEHSRINSYLRRTTRFLRSSQNVGEGDTPLSKRDFLALLTAVDELYAQSGSIIEMQQLDLVEKESVGSGAVFQASRIVQASVRPSATVANQTTTKEVTVIIKGASIPLFNTHGQPLDNGEASQAAESFIMEVRILSHAYLRSHPHVVRLEGFGWEYNVEVCVSNIV
jgi:hypothetical protein